VTVASDTFVEYDRAVDAAENNGRAYKFDDEGGGNAIHHPLRHRDNWARIRRQSHIPGYDGIVTVTPRDYMRV